MPWHPLSLAPPPAPHGAGDGRGLGWSKKEKGPQPSRTTGTEVPTVGGLPCTSYDSTTVRGSQPFSWAHENDPTRQPRPVDQHRSGQRPAVKGGPDGPLAQPLTAGRRPDNPHSGGRRRRKGAAEQRLFRISPCGGKGARSPGGEGRHGLEKVRGPRARGGRLLFRRGARSPAREGGHGR